MLKRSPIRKRSKARTKSLRWELILDGAVRQFPDGRQVCQSNTAGKQEYERRIWAMIERQNYKCCNCRKVVKQWTDLTFEHENGRGASKRDDRVNIGDRRINGASHQWCNSMRGSKRTKIYHGE